MEQHAAQANPAAGSTPACSTRGYPHPDPEYRLTEKRYQAPHVAACVLGVPDCCNSQHMARPTGWAAVDPRRQSQVRVLPVPKRGLRNGPSYGAVAQRQSPGIHSPGGAGSNPAGTDKKRERKVRNAEN